MPAATAATAARRSGGPTPAPIALPASPAPSTASSSPAEPSLTDLVTVDDSTTPTVWCRHLDRFIERHLGRPWSCQQNGMFAQGTRHTFEVRPSATATAAVDRWLASEPAGCPGRLHQPGFAEEVDIHTATILSELCNRGLLDEGELRIHVWW